MSENINVPGLGQTKKAYVYVGGAVLATAGIVWYRSRHATSSGLPTTSSGPSSGISGTSDQFPSDGTTGNANDPYSIDPLTGTTYGNEGSSGSGSFTQGTTTYPITPEFTNNAEWSQYAENFLTGSSGMQPGTVSNALGDYITGHSVTPAQEAIINDAIAFAGYPPVAGPGNFPPSIRVSGSKQGGKTYADNPVKGLKTKTANEIFGTLRHSVTVLTWDESQHASSYKVTLKQGSRTVHSGTVHNRQYIFRNLKAGEYTVDVLANPARKGAKPGSASFKI